MINTSVNPITVVKGGVETRLDTLAYNVKTKSGIGSKLAPLRGSSVEVPGRSGSIWRPGRKRDEGSVILSMWAQDTDTDGVTAADQYGKWRSNMDMIVKLFDTQNEQIEIREYLTPVAIGDPLPSTGYRRAICEVRAAIDPEVLGRFYGEFVVECIINGTYWEDYQLSEFTSPANALAISTHVAAPFAGMTAPLEDAQIVVNGPLTNPRVTDTRTGHWVQLTGTIVFGQQWSLDSGLWLSATGSGIDYNAAGGTTAAASTTSSGRFSPRFFGLSAGPDAATGPSIQLSGTGANTGTLLRIRGRRKFH